MREYYDLKRLKGPTLKKGDKVYLFRKNIKKYQNIKNKRLYDKFDFGKKGPYLIEKSILRYILVKITPKIQIISDYLY